MNLSRHRSHQTTGPIAWTKRWGFFRPVVMLILLTGALVQVIGLAGCAGSASEDCLDPRGGDFSAAEDSLGIEEFYALDPAHRQARRDRAEAWLDRSRSADKAGDRIQALANAAGLIPDDPEIWLDLARIWRWIGDNLRTETCLDNAAAAVRRMGQEDSDFFGRSEGYRRDAALRTGIQRAWLHYDRAEYYEGLDWAEAALKMEPGNATAWLVKGLLASSLGQRSQGYEIANDLRRSRGYHADIAWIMSNLDRSWGRHREAFNFFVNLRPFEEHAAECWRDMGLAAERVGEWSYARRWYRESAAALPFVDTSCLMEISHDRLDASLGSPPQPVWMAFGRHFVTGSRSAYTAYALERFDLATTPDEIDVWGGLVVNSAGICIRLNENKPWALKARGIVFSRTGKQGRGLEDLQKSARGLKKMGLEDGRLEAEIGHLFLLDEKQSSAILHLRRAVDLDAKNAGAWSDLGLALIMSGNRAEAEKALSRSLEIDPESATAWYNRGLMNLHAGDLEQAEADLAKAAELAPENQNVARLLQQIGRTPSENK